MRTSLSGCLLVASLVGCSGTTHASAQPPEPEPTERTAAAPDPPEKPAASAPAPAPAPAASPSGPMHRAEAEKFVLALINRDRAAAGLSAVTWDETAAVAGRRHAADLAAHGLTAHFGTDGSVPEKRYTEAGGKAMVMENAGCFADAVTRELDPDPVYLPERLEKIERTFMDEIAPNDGHKQNILTKRHNAVGIGLAQPKGIDIPCLTEEFLDDYGDYAPIPRKASPGAKIRVEGKMRGPAQIAGVGFSRADLRTSIPVAEIRKMHGYPIPSPYIMFFPAGFLTKIVLDVDRAKNTFSIEAPIGEGNKPGLYGVSVWGTFPGSKDLVILSLRTVEVR